MRSRSLFLLVLSITPKDVIFSSVLIIKSWGINKKSHRLWQGQNLLQVVSLNYCFLPVTVDILQQVSLIFLQGKKQFQTEFLMYQKCSKDYFQLLHCQPKGLLCFHGRKLNTSTATSGALFSWFMLNLVHLVFQQLSYV